MKASKTLKLTLEEYGYKLSDLIYPSNGLEMAIEEAMERHAQFYHDAQVNKKTKVKEVIKKANKNKAESIEDRKLNLYKNTLSLFVKKLPPDNLILDYFNKEDAHIELQDWIGMNIKEDIHWSTSIGIMDACDNIIEEAISNANIKSDYSIGFTNK